jgi:hypothetical protein
MNITTIRKAAVATLVIGAIGACLVGTSASARPTGTGNAPANNASVAAAAAVGTLRDTDRPLMNGGQADFGTGGLNVSLSRQPNSAGTLTWHQSLATPTTPSIITAHLTGRVYWDDVLSGGCARVRLSLFDTNGVSAGDPVYSHTVCQIGLSGTAPSKSVDLSFKSINAHRALVTTQIGANASTLSSEYVNTAKQSWYFGQVPQD